MKNKSKEELIKDLQKSETQRLNQMNVISEFQIGLSRLLYNCDTGVAFWIDAEKMLKKHLNEATSMDGGVCDNCEPLKGAYLGVTCPKCLKPFRSIRQTASELH